MSANRRNLNSTKFIRRATLIKGFHQILRTAWHFPSAVDVSPADNLFRFKRKTMSLRSFLMCSVFSFFMVCALSPILMSQEGTTSSQRQSENTFEGTVVSSTRDTLVVRTEDNQFQLFVFDRYTTKPRSIPNGSRVRVVSTPGEEGGGRLASNISMSGSDPERTTGTCARSSSTNSSSRSGPGT
jgi:hypothetical protein